MLTSLSYRENSSTPPSQQKSSYRSGMIVSIIVLQIILPSLIAALTRNRIPDERDHLLELQGYRAGDLALASLRVLGLGMFWLHGTQAHSELDSQMIGLHFLSVSFAC